MKASLASILCLSVSDAFSTPGHRTLYAPIGTRLSSQGDDNASAKIGIEPVVKTDFDSFDYNSQWYPVIWAVDIPLNEPVRVSLFDVHYVVWKTLHGDTDDVSLKPLY